MSNQIRTKKKFKDWFLIEPHITVVLPDKDVVALRGINQDLTRNTPYTTILNSKVGLPIWVIPVAKGGE